MSDLPAKPPRLSLTEMTELVMPNDTNPLGAIMGGRVMHFIDICGALAAARHAGSICVTASVDSLDFHTPIRVGEVVYLKAVVTWAGRTSIEVMVEVYAENFTGARRHTSTAYLTFVAVGPDGRPTPVPPVIAETPGEERRLREGAERHKERLARRAAHQRM